MKKDILQQLVLLEARLYTAPRFPIVATVTTTSDRPESSGVYAVWERTSGGIVYVGESSNLNHRLGDFTKPHRHRISRILTELPLAFKDFEKFEVSWIADFMGRRELEDFLNIRWLKKIPKRLSPSEVAEIKSESSKSPRLPPPIFVNPRAAAQNALATFVAQT